MKMSFKLFILFIFLLFFIEPLFGFEFKIARVGPDYVTANLKVQKGKPSLRLEILMVYDVFEKMEIIDGKRVFVNFIDSVYLADVKTDELYFGFTWEGEKKLLKSNYILSSTERYYAFPDLPFEQVIKEPDLPVDEEIEDGSEEPGEKDPKSPRPKPPKFAFMVLSGYTMLHTLDYGGSEEATFGPGYITADLVVLLPFDLGIRITGAAQHTFEQVYIQASGINYKGLGNSFIKIYTELGASYPFSLTGESLTDPSVVLFAQYGLLFDFRGLYKRGFFAIDLYVNGNFPINTILEGMYLNYGLKAGVRF